MGRISILEEEGRYNQLKYEEATVERIYYDIAYWWDVKERKVLECFKRLSEYEKQVRNSYDELDFMEEMVLTGKYPDIFMKLITDFALWFDELPCFFGSDRVSPETLRVFLKHVKFPNDFDGRRSVQNFINRKSCQDDNHSRIVMHEDVYMRCEVHCGECSSCDESHEHASDPSTNCTDKTSENLLPGGNRPTNFAILLADGRFEPRAKDLMELCGSFAVENEIILMRMLLRDSRVDDDDELGEVVKHLLFWCSLKGDWDDRDKYQGDQYALLQDLFYNRGPFKCANADVKTLLRNADLDKYRCRVELRFVCLLEGVFFRKRDTGFLDLDVPLAKVLNLVIHMGREHFIVDPFVNVHFMWGIKCLVQKLNTHTEALRSCKNWFEFAYRFIVQLSRRMNIENLSRVVSFLHGTHELLVLDLFS